MFNENPVADAFSKVKCNGATGPGSIKGHTKIRIAVAGWFNGYGEEIATKVRQLWDRGCDVKIVTTLLGRGVNRALRNPAGRGPIPIHSLYQDNDGDGVPERYLHMKSVSIQGVYGGNTAANLVWTGSPNWSARAARSDEIWVKVFDAPVLARAYANHIDYLRTIVLDQGDNGDGRRHSPPRQDAAVPAGPQVLARGRPAQRPGPARLAGAGLSRPWSS